MFPSRFDRLSVEVADSGRVLVRLLDRRPFLDNRRKDVTRDRIGYGDGTWGLEPWTTVLAATGRPTSYGLA